MSTRKNRWKSWVLWAGVIVAAYAFTRITNLTKLPIFTDEAIYIRWSQIGSIDPAWRFISLTDGKQPMFTWVMMVLLRVVHADPLFVGRLVSVISGVFSMVAVFLLTQVLFQKRNVSILATILYLVSPFALMYDRMALYDSMSAAFALWSLYLGIRLVQTNRLDIAMILGLVLGGGMLNKTSGFLSLYLLPATLILFDWKKKDRGKRLITWIGRVVVAAVISQGMYSVLRLSPLFHMVGQKNGVFVYPLQEWLEHPFRFVQGNLNGLLDWSISYLTKPMFLAALASFGISLSRTREKVLLLISWIVPLLGLAVFGRVLYPRFILFMTLPLLLLSALTIDWLWMRYRKTILGFVLIGVILFPSIRMDYYIVSDPLYAPIPQADRGQYIDDWPSGWGIREVNAFLEQESRNGPLTVYTDGTFGLFMHGVEIYLVDNQNVEIQGIYPIPDAMPADMIDDVATKPTYLILNQTLEAPPWNIELLASYQKGLRTDRTLRLYQVHPLDETYESDR